MHRRTHSGLRWLRLACGCALVVTGAWGCVYGVRASTAQRLYKRAKYGHWVGTRWERPPLTEAARVLPLTERAHRLYRYNYYAPIYAAIIALSEALTTRDAAVFERTFRAAQHWSRIALRLNPYDIEAMHVHCRVLWEQGEMDAAIAYWREDALERAYWKPDRHEFLVRLYLDAGKTSQAIEAGRLLRHGPMRREIRAIEARQRDERRRVRAAD